MKCIAGFFAKVIFWVENVIYIFVFLAYELALVPIIFLRVIYNIMKLSSLLSLLPLLIIWFALSPIVLILGVFKDLSNFLKILCNY